MHRLAYPAAMEQRCAPLHESRGVDPVGTAPRWDAVLVVEVHKPWPRDISEAEPFSQLCDAPSATITGADGRVWRPQGVIPGSWSAEGPSATEGPTTREGPSTKEGPGAGAVPAVRVIAFERPAGDGTDPARAPSGPFTRREWSVPTHDRRTVADLCSALLAADHAAIGAFADLRDDPPAATVDLLVCTHGSRDVCCGGSGTALQAGLLEAVAAEELADVTARVWRTSHAGGHRFAPTALSFPDGVSWAHLDVATATALVRRAPDVAALLEHVRGAVTLPGGAAQAADREGFRRHGWAWLDSERTAVPAGPDGQAGEAESWTVSAVDGPSVRVDVEVAEQIPRPPCGVSPEDDASGDTDDVWRVLSS